MDAIIKYPQIAIDELYTNQRFVSLLLNIPNADLSDPAIKKNYLDHALDYGYVDGTATSAESYCFLDTAITQRSPTIKIVVLNIIVLVHKGIMDLSPAFKSFGNRRDNLIREIDYTLHGNQKFGIGGLELVDYIKPINVSNDFSAKRISLAVPTFAV